jgi:hypothetical protein
MAFLVAGGVLSRRALWFCAMTSAKSILRCAGAPPVFPQEIVPVINNEKQINILPHTLGPIAVVITARHFP